MLSFKNPEQRRNVIKCLRHRQLCRAAPLTPPDFWDLVFLDVPVVDGGPRPPKVRKIELSETPGEEMGWDSD